MTLVTPRIRPLDTFDDLDRALEELYRTDAAAFGGPVDPAQCAAKRPLIQADRFHLAELDGVWAGAAGSFPVRLTLPGGAGVAAAAISDVGVVPTHRRRGVLSAMISHQLDDLARRGESIAVLHASEAGIYRRFGFGPATRWRQLRADARRVRFRDDVVGSGGSLRVVDRAEAWHLCPQVHDRVRRRVPGGLSRSEDWWAVVLGDAETYIGGSPRRLVMVHADDAGSPDGYAIYEVREDWSSGQAQHHLSVWELVGEHPGAEVALWRALMHHDLVATVTGPIAIDHILWDVVEDPRQVGIDWQQDLLWARLLDVATVLSARTYRGSGRVVVEVDDEFRPDCGGTFSLDVDAGVGTCTRVERPAHMTLSASDLAGMVLGDSSFRRLARAGRIRSADPGALVLADHLFGVDPLPWCWVRF